MRRRISVALVLVLALIGASSAQGVQIGGKSPGADVAADVKPDRLPRRSFAPAKLVLSGKLEHGEKAATLKTLDLRLDGRLRTTANTKGLATCTSRLSGTPLAQARRLCDKALIGSGSVTREDFLGSSIRDTVLLFNAAGRGRILMYSYVPAVIPAAAVSSGTVKGRSIQLRFPFLGGATTSFQFRIGRTWRDRGKRRSYLVGRCAGRFANRLTLRFGRTTLSGTMTDPCRGR